MFEYIGPRHLMGGDVRFRVERGDDRRVWVVSREALDDHFGGANGLESAFDGAVWEIMDAANKRFDANEVEPDGSVIVRSSDFEGRQ